MGILVALLVLSLLIFFHELGHFAAARFFGVHVEVFSIGFGKELWSRKWGDTQWRISAVPLGGYVKMKGQDDTDPTKRVDAPDSYNAKKPWQRIVILLAGPFANFATAFALYYIIAVAGVPKLLPYVGATSPDTPAATLLRKGDKIVAIDQTPVRYFEDIGAYIAETKRDTIALDIERNGTRMHLRVPLKTVMQKNIFGEEEPHRIIGIRADGKSVVKHYGPIEAFGYAAEQTWEASKLIFLSVQKLLTGVVSPDNLGGVITIVDVTAKASHQGLLALLWFTALISVNLGVLNLLPIPALDGGHIVFNLYEWVTRKAPHEAVLYYLTVAGWMILLGLMGLGLYNDIHRLAG